MDVLSEPEGSISRHQGCDTHVCCWLTSLHGNEGLAFQVELWNSRTNLQSVSHVVHTDQMTTYKIRHEVTMAGLWLRCQSCEHHLPGVIDKSPHVLRCRYMPQNVHEPWRLADTVVPLRIRRIGNKIRGHRGLAWQTLEQF